METKGLWMRPMAFDVAIAMDAHRDYGLTSQQADRVLEEAQTVIFGVPKLRA